ncbi:MAG TPA: hypothetical protein VK508_11460 [Cyclobacteriaceae bacterium]|nr:hypothetical protein [Cyclobacteriaceae bacterium]
MSLWQRFRRSNFIIKLTSWEYWPFGILQGPVFLYWLFLAARARSLFFFSASNPGILSGGMMGESKSEVLRMVPEDVKPKTVLINVPATTASVLKQLSEEHLSFPLIFKPDLGERGWMVRKINDERDIEKYLGEIRIDFIAQTLVDLPLEFGVFYIRYPDKPDGRVTSVTMKQFLSVTGDGKSTLRDLILSLDRAKLQWDLLEVKYSDELDHVLRSGEVKELVSIGNHCLGTTFINANHLITPKLHASFDRISNQVKGFNFGRYDLRCASFEDLEAGRVMIVELNGCGAEPAHIYHPGASFWTALGTLFVHVHNMYRVSAINHSMGVPYLSFQEGRAIYRKFKALKSGT